MRRKTAPKDHPRPGLSKARAEPLVSRRAMPLVKSSDYRFRELFERADVMSEGKTRSDADGAMYYGSTSVLLPFASRGGGIPDEHADEVLALITADPHARVRAIRIACLEAQVRARAPIGRVRAEMLVRRDRRGVCIVIEVEARVFEQSASDDGAAGVNAKGPRAERG